MSRLKHRTDMHEVSQKPRYDHVVWSASYQTAGGNRRYSDQELNVMLTSADSPRLNLKPSAMPGSRDVSPSRGSYSSAPMSKLAHSNDSTAGSVKRGSRKLLIRKDLRSPTFQTDQAATNMEKEFQPGAQKWEQVSANKNHSHVRGCGTYENIHRLTHQDRPSVNGQFQFKGKSSKPSNSVSIVISDGCSQNAEHFPALAPRSRPTHNSVPRQSPKKTLFPSSSRTHVKSPHTFTEGAGLSNAHPYNKTVPNYLEPDQGKIEFRPKSAPENVTSKEIQNINVRSSSTLKQNKPNSFNLMEDSSSSDCSDFDDDANDSNLDDCFAHLTWRPEESESSRYREKSEGKMREDSAISKRNYDDGSRQDNIDGYKDRGTRTPSICNVIITNNYGTHSGRNGRPNFMRKSSSHLETGTKNGQRIASASVVNSALMRREMQRRFSTESWYQKALKTLRELPAFESRNKSEYSADPDEVSKRLCRHTASSRAREAATGRLITDERGSDRKISKPQKRSVVVDFMNVDDMRRFKGQKHVTNSEMQSIIQRLSEHDPRQAQDSQKQTARKNMSRV